MDQQAGGSLLRPPTGHQRLRSWRVSSETHMGGEGKADKLPLIELNQYLITTQGPKNTELPPHQELPVITPILVQEASKGREEQ